MITAGKLNRRIVIQSPINAVDEYGQKTQGWEKVAEVFAEIRPIGAKEKLRAMEYDAIDPPGHGQISAAFAADSWRRCLAHFVWQPHVYRQLC